MVFQDVRPVPEIDNELILFRELFKIKNKFHNSLLIAQAGRITQHLVEFLAKKHDVLSEDKSMYDSDFKFLLNECDFIPEFIREEFILPLYEYRKNIVHSKKHEKELAGLMLSFLKSFIQILNWFDNYYRYNLKYENEEFKEIDNTMKELNKQINKLEQNSPRDNYEEIYEYPDFEPNSVEQFPNESEMIRAIYLSLPEFRNGMNTLLQNDEIHIQYHENHTNQLNNLTNTVNDMNETVNDIDDKTDQILIEFRKLHDEIDNYRQEKDISIKFDNAKTEEEKDQLMWEFAEKCGKIMRDHSEKYINTNNYKREKYNLIESLGEQAWNKLSRKSQTFLITSKVTFNNLKSLEDIIDYSGVCVLVTKALEAELCKRFYKGFGKYLFKKYEKDYSKYHTSMYSYNKETKQYYQLTSNKKCDLGRITCILGYNDWGMSAEEYEYNLSTIIEYSKKYFKNYSDEKIRATLIEYGSYVDEIRVEYRNKAAHTNELTIIKAEECFRYVLYAEQVLKIMLDSFDQ